MPGTVTPNKDVQGFNSSPVTTSSDTLGAELHESQEFQDRNLGSKSNHQQICPSLAYTVIHTGRHNRISGNDPTTPPLVILRSLSQANPPMAGT